MDPRLLTDLRKHLARELHCTEDMVIISKQTRHTDPIAGTMVRGLAHCAERPDTQLHWAIGGV